MGTSIKHISFLFLGIAFILFNSGCGNSETASNQAADLVLYTDMGEIALNLFEETPTHRDNFLKLAKQGYFDGQAFHRVISDFMIQAGDPRTIAAYPPTDTTAPEGPGYTLAPEFGPHCVNIRGRLGAARYGDDKNPDQRSSGSQFYIVAGGEPISLKEIDSMAMVYTAVLRGEAYTQYEERKGDSSYQATFNEYLEETGFKQWNYPHADRNVYLREGGAPWLDFTYTVFGEVVSGMEIVDLISITATDEYDRPRTAIRIDSTSLSP